MANVIDMNQEVNHTTRELMDCFLTVHKQMGPGLLESIYEECLCYELKKRNISFERQKALPLRYDRAILESGLRLDLVVDGKVIVELKSIEKILPVHEAQVISYLKLADMEVGFLVNFNTPLMRDGVKRFVRSNANSASSAAPR